MKRITKIKALVLISIGIFIVAISQAVSQFIALPDFVKGSMLGVGLGLLLVALIFGNFKSVQ